MGPGDRFEIYKTQKGEFGLGIYYYKFPYDHTIFIQLIKWNIKLGFGKSYIERNNEE